MESKSVLALFMSMLVAFLGASRALLAEEKVVAGTRVKVTGAEVVSQRL